MSIAIWSTEEKNILNSVVIMLDNACRTTEYFFPDPRAMGRHPALPDRNSLSCGKKTKKSRASVASF